LLLVGYLVLSGYGMRRAIVADAEYARALEAIASAGGADAATHLLRARQASLGDPAAGLLIARGAASQGEYEHVVGELEEVLRLHPNQINAKLNLGYAQLQLGLLDAAERSFQTALEILPESLTAQSNLGLIRYRRQDYRAAIRCYERVLELAERKRHYGERRRTDQHRLVAQLQLGACHAALGEIESAIAHYERALRARPELEQAQEVLERLYQQRDDGKGSAE
jgi:tetratricopeptide (TPR) repeat protein